MNQFKKYITNLLSIHTEILFHLIKKAIKSKNKKIAVVASNLRFRLKGFKLKIKYEEDLSLFSIVDGRDVHFFGNLLRGLDCYENGLRSRANELYSSYLLENLSFEKDDIVIDCGANYGDLWLCLKDKINPSSYITFEPGVFEHLCLKKNAPQGIHNQLGLSNKREIATFYVSEKGGDSSIVEPPNYTDTIKINTISLNEYVFNYHISHIKLLKLEAEGFEPEILEGASEILHKIAFISIDGGFERGINQDETFSELNNKLLKSSFKMVSINFEWGRALFKNSNLITD